MKLLIDPDGNASLVEDDGQGDPYELHVKIVGDFEAAIIGQENYDGVSGATGSASSNKNSNVTVYGARTEKGSVPADSDWKELDASADSNSGYVTKCTVSIVPDTEQGTDENASSGMTGSFWPAISSSLTLSGTPKDAGSYRSLWQSPTIRDAPQRATPCPSASIPARKRWPTVFLPTT